MEGNGLKGEGAEGGVARLTQVHDLEIHVLHLDMTIIAVLEWRVTFCSPERVGRRTV